MLEIARLARQVVVTEGVDVASTGFLADLLEHR